MAEFLFTKIIDFTCKNVSLGTAIKLVRKDEFKDQKILMKYCFKATQNFMYIKILTMQCVLSEEIMPKY